MPSKTTGPRRVFSSKTNKKKIKIEFLVTNIINRALSLILSTQ